MESPGGGAEARARSRQYDYGANSNLVVNTGSRPSGAHHEPTGEPQTLSGRIRARSFGDRAFRARPPGLEGKRGESRGKKARDAASADLPHRDAKRMRRAAAVRPEVSVLSLAYDALYNPRTRETRTAYEALLSVIQQQLGGQPLDVLGDAADEVLAALKDDKIRNPDKKKVIEKLINTVSDQMFDQLVSIGKLITDFHDTVDSAGVPSGDTTDMPLDDDIGITVEFEEDEDDKESNLYQVCTCS